MDAVVCEQGMDAVRNGFNERFEEGGSSTHICLFDEFDHGELRRPVYPPPETQHRPGLHIAYPLRCGIRGELAATNGVRLKRVGA